MTTRSHNKANDYLNMHLMKHNSLGIYACPKHKYDAIQENKQNKVLLLTQCLLPLDICISPMEYLSPYKCA